MVGAPDCQMRALGFKSTYCHFVTWAILSAPFCLCLLEETLRDVGPFYLVIMSREVPAVDSCLMSHDRSVNNMA